MDGGQVTLNGHINPVKGEEGGKNKGGVRECFKEREGGGPPAKKHEREVG